MTDKQEGKVTELGHVIDELKAQIERLRAALQAIRREEDPKAMKAIAEREDK